MEQEIQGKQIDLDLLMSLRWPVWLDPIRQCKGSQQSMGTEMGWL